MKGKVITPNDKLMGGPETAALQHALCGLIKQGVKPIVLDLSRVRWINSAGLGLLISTHMQCRRSRNRLILLNPSPKVQSMMHITKLASVFHVRFR